MVMMKKWLCGDDDGDDGGGAFADNCCWYFSAWYNVYGCHTYIVLVY